MRPYREILTQLLLRAVWALTLGAAGWHLVAFIGSGWSAAPVLLVAMACFIGAGVAVAGPLARLFAEPFGAMYTPTATQTALKPDYSVAEALKNKGKPGGFRH